MNSNLAPGSAISEIELARRLVSKDEAEFILLGLLGWRRHQIYFERTRLNPVLVRRFRKKVRQAATGVPVQYLVNSAPFLDLDIYVNRRVFIPRPETEELVLRAAKLVAKPKLILDYGTGSGCIAIALARIFPQAQVWAVDRSRAALAVARRNIRAYCLEDRIHLLRVETVTAPEMQFLTGKVDLLIANPPYVPKERWGRLPAKVRDYEPRYALDGGEKGMTVVSMLLSQGVVVVKPGGILAIEIDSSQSELVRELLPGATVERDLWGRVRYLFWRREVV